ncbi:MAG: outer membrane biogenesis lipoprotein LolB [Enterobacterales bacterium]|jgi:outer membrane biogenesis lipoprotein LolB
MAQLKLFFISIVVVLILAACVPTPVVRNETINELIIRNQTKSALEEVELRVPKTGKIVACSTVFPATECSLGFPEFEHQRNHATLSWLQRGQKYQRDIITKIPEDLDMSKPAIVIITIQDNGQITSRLDSNRL